MFCKQSLDPCLSILSSLVHAKNRWRVKVLIDRYIHFLTKVEKFNGRRVALETAKQIHNNVKRDALGLPNEYNYPIPIRTRRNEIPYCLRQFGYFTLQNSSTLKAVAISISAIYRVATDTPNVSYSDVVGEFRGDYGNRLYKDFESFIKEDFCPSIKPLLDEAVTHRENVDDQVPTIILSASPNAKRSLVSTLADAASLLYGVEKDIYDSVARLYRAFDASHKLETLHGAGNVVETWPGDALSRYAFVPDKGGKTRGITLGNYFIQDSLKPIHDDLMYCLMHMPEDYTYRQERVSSKVLKSFDKGMKSFCYDMSGATDRFPKRPQSLLLQQLYGSNIATAWDTIMNVPLHHANNVIRFAVGQPMGLYSSFAAFSLTHHSLVRFCFYYYGTDYRGKYMILGDDIVIFDAKAAKLYRKMLEVVLGVSVSLHKSVLSMDKIVAEFCKRLFLQGNEITALGSGLIAGPYCLTVRSWLDRAKRFDSWTHGELTTRLRDSGLSSLTLSLEKLPRLGGSYVNIAIIYLLLYGDLPRGWKKFFMRFTYMSPLSLSRIRSYITYYELGALARTYLSSDVKIDNINRHVDNVIKGNKAGIIDPRVQALNWARNRVRSLHLRARYLTRAPFIKLSFMHKILSDLDDAVLLTDALIREKRDPEKGRLLRQEIIMTQNIIAFGSILHESAGHFYGKATLKKYGNMLKLSL